MAALNYYERYCGDYQRDTAHLSLMEHGAYTQLLDHYYATEMPLPAEMARLYRVCRAVQPDELAAVDFVAMQFFPVGDDGNRHNPRADQEIEKARKRIDRSRANGVTGGDVTRSNFTEPGHLYAIRLMDGRIKVGISSWVNRRLSEHRKKFGHGIKLVHSVPVAEMGRAEGALLGQFEAERHGEILTLDDQGQKRLVAVMNAIRTPEPPDPGGGTDGSGPRNPDDPGGGSGGSPHAIHHVSALASGSRAPMTPGAEACLAIKAAGVPDINPSDAELIDLLNQGVTPEQFGDLAAELKAVDSTTRFRYIVRTMAGRRRDAARRTGARAAVSDDDVFAGAR